MAKRTVTEKGEGFDPKPNPFAGHDTVAIGPEPYQVVPTPVPVVPAGAPETLARTGRLVYWQLVEAAHDFAVAGLSKDSKNVSQDFKFRGIDSLMNLAAPILVRHRLLMLPRVLSRTVAVRETRNGGQLFSVALDVEFTFVSALDGSQHTVRVVGEAMDSGDKGSNKAMSAAFKYAMFQSFCIPVEGAMEEADLTSPEETVAPKPEGYAAVKRAVQDTAQLGSAYVKAYAKSIKDTPLFAAYDHLVKQDADWASIKALAESADLLAASKADIKTEGTRVPGEPNE